MFPEKVGYFRTSEMQGLSLRTDAVEIEKPREWNRILTKLRLGGDIVKVPERVKWFIAVITGLFGSWDGESDMHKNNEINGSK